MPFGEDPLGQDWDRVWPQGQQVAPGEAQRVDCASCGLRWLVHDDLAGFRMRCDCGQWLDVPARTASDQAEQRLLASLDGLEGAGVPQRYEGGVPAPVAPDDVLAELPRDESEDDPFASQRRVAPGAVMQAGALRRADLKSRQRWLGRSLLEIVAMLLAILVPHVLIHYLVAAEDTVLFVPLASLAGGVLVLLVGAFSRGYTFGAVRGFAAIFSVEAVLVAGVAVLLALGYEELIRGLMSEWRPGEGEDEMGLGLLRKELGLGMALFVVALCPAIFEELAFRGLLQGRFSALYGVWQGLLLSAVFFALAHGVTLGLPFHFGLGLWFGSLRLRSGSVVPGMIGHALYNGGLVVLSG